MVRVCCFIDDEQHYSFQATDSTTIGAGSSSTATASGFTLPEHQQGRRHFLGGLQQGDGDDWCVDGSKVAKDDKEIICQQHPVKRGLKVGISSR